MASARNNMPIPTNIIEIAPGIVHMPFTILIDTAEKHPWEFANLTARSFIDKDMRKYAIKTEIRYLGVGMGDYSIDLFQDRIAIERKSMEDFQGTLLGWPHDISDLKVKKTWNPQKSIHRRGRFKAELRKLQALECKAVIIEAPLGRCIAEMEQWGVRSAEENGKYLHATYISWQQQFRVPFIFCDDRRLAEVTAFRILEQFWDRHRSKYRQRKKDSQRQLVAV